MYWLLHYLFTFAVFKQLSFVSTLTVKCPRRDVFASAHSKWSPVPSQRPRGSSQHAVRRSTAGEERRRRVTARGVHLGTWSTNPLSMSPVRAQPPLCSPALFLLLLLCAHHLPPPQPLSSVSCAHRREIEKKKKFPSDYANAMGSYSFGVAMKLLSPLE